MGKKISRELYRQEQLPIFQNRMYENEEEAKACPKGDIVLVEDQDTGLIFNASFQPELMNYDKNYQNEQAFSPLFQAHLKIVSGIIERHLGKQELVEIGCGKGSFLETLLANGFDAIGFDPTYEGSNPRIHCCYFQQEIGIKTNGLILRHVLEHIQNPLNFLHQLKEANGGSGRIYIEVPCLQWICEHQAWFDIFYEHVNYFQISDFYRIFGTVIESGKLFGGQYLYVVADLETIQKPKINVRNNITLPLTFTDKIHTLTHSVIWGGASKGVIFALLKERAGHPITTVIDINPEKQGKYLPATGLLVQSPENVLATLPNGTTIYVMNSNYLEEIKEMSNYKFNYLAIDNG